MDKLMLSVPQACEAMEVGKTRLYELIASGSLPVIRWGRNIRIPVKEIEKWIEENKAASGVGG